MSTEQVATRPTQLHWFKSSFSGPEGGDCLEVAASPSTVHLRDSKNVQGPTLQVPANSWRAFVSYASGYADVPA